MKKVVIFLTSVFFTLNLFSQSIVGTWYGELEVGGQTVPLIIHIQQTANGYYSTMDSPKQKAYGIPMYKTSFAGGNLLIISKQGFSYRGFLYEGVITGNFNQNEREYPLTFTREKFVEEAPKELEKPQETRDFISEDVSFENPEAGITLAGTLTMPLEGGNFPAVILISGSGPQNRDEEIFGLKPFLTLSDYLTRNGIAVLRYDDRGVAASEGVFSTATSVDFASDAKAALDYLQTRPEINKSEIGLIGHSEGGMIAPMVASKTDEVDFLVLLAAPGIPGNELLLLQNKMLAKASGMTGEKLNSFMESKKKLFQIAMQPGNKASLKKDLTAFFKKNHPGISQSQIEMGLKQITSPWMQYFLKYDPRPVLEKVDVPVLALNGGKDLQVGAEANLQAIEKALKEGGNENVTTKMLPGLNHLFQKAETGLPSEYETAGQPFTSGSKEIIVEWIMEKVE